MNEGEHSPGRTLGIDLGSKRIGVAVSDGRGTLASPLVVVERSGDVAADHRRIAALVREEEAERVVVGLPVTLAGEVAMAAGAVVDEVKQLQEALDVPVETWDERLTSAAAHKTLQLQGVPEKKRRDQIDKWAAAVILQGWLDRQTR